MCAFADWPGPDAHGRGQVSGRRTSMHEPLLVSASLALAEDEEFAPNPEEPEEPEEPTTAGPSIWPARSDSDLRGRALTDGALRCSAPLERVLGHEDDHVLAVAVDDGIHVPVVVRRLAAVAHDAHVVADRAAAVVPAVLPKQVRRRGA